MRSLDVLRAMTVAALACASAVGWASTSAGLAGTAHDFTASGSGDVKGAPGTGLCTFCHTPQQGKGAALMWNHTLSPNVFRWDSASTFGGTPLPQISGETYKGVSARCLSCHDGSVAVGDVASFNGQPDNGPAVLSATRMTELPAKYQVGVGGNLSGNHPVGVPFPLGGTPNRYNGVTNGGSGGGFAPTEWQAYPAVSANAGVRLYRDDGAGNISVLAPGATTINAGIECSSCHDPHNKAAVDVMFLRGKLAGRSRVDGYLCQQCHNL